MIKIYTTPTCVYCRMAKDFFNQHSVQYEEHNVMEDLKAREEMVSKSGQMGVPVIDVEGELIIGFDKERLSELLHITS